MRVYVANCTEFNFIACTRPPEMGTLSITIAPGQQISYAGDRLTTPQIDAVVAQLRKYGLMGTDEVDRHKDFVTLLFQRDRPVPAQFMQMVMERNKGIRRDEGAERRKQAAVGIDSRAAALAFEHQMPPQRHTEIEIVEDTDRGSTMPREAGEKPVSVGLHVDHRAPPGMEPPRAKSRRGQRRAA